MSSPRLLLAILRAAADLTGALDGWLLARGPAGLDVVAGVGEAGERLAGRTFGHSDGSAGYAASMGQPMARQLRPGDPMLGAGALAWIGRPARSVLSVPCDDGGEIRGVVELIDRYDGRFTVDDIEVATMLAAVAAVALGDRAPAAAAPPSPDDLMARLQLLRDADPGRYGEVAAAMAILLGR
jgi:GAF domain-containing protein